MIKFGPLRILPPAGRPHREFAAIILRLRFITLHWHLSPTKASFEIRRRVMIFE